ncbi:hypothetical protein [Idiomarina seosinensis]|uniref:Uncharacterized protein n=1 Tax=Idiomarina seosinensis TaxID=281739 RepID=A0A432ZIF0_9GAMM|nr:hypothetical protein [Idiomarina seosinensis]RUO77766.1 hypothetical protein CWI81_04620 [Idiomarina seosinensis]
MWQRVFAILVVIVGLLMAVLGVVSEELDTYIRSLGALIMLVGIIWLYRQPSSRLEREGEVPPLRWYQSPILWVPIVGIIIFLISLAL